MDFHAVVEAAIDGRWRVVDATTLAPATALVRIATGRDASDTAFLTVQSGRADLVRDEGRRDGLPGAPGRRPHPPRLPHLTHRLRRRRHRVPEQAVPRIC